MHRDAKKYRGRHAFIPVFYFNFIFESIRLSSYEAAPFPQFFLGVYTPYTFPSREALSYEADLFQCVALVGTIYAHMCLGGSYLCVCDLECDLQ